MYDEYGPGRTDDDDDEDDENDDEVVLESLFSSIKPVVTINEKSINNFPVSVVNLIASSCDFGSLQSRSRFAITCRTRSMLRCCSWRERDGCDDDELMIKEKSFTYFLVC